MSKNWNHKKDFKLVTKCCESENYMFTVFDEEKDSFNLQASRDNE